MAKKANAVKQSIEKMWPDIRKRLRKISSDALELAKYSEDKVKKLSQKSKLQFELVALQLKREQLYYKLGKTACTLLNTGKLKTKELKALHTQIIDLTRRISSTKKGLKK
jgi:hypothetical protein